MKNDSPPPQTRAENLGGRLWKILMGLFLIMVGSVFVSYLWNSYQRASTMDDWVETPCLIDSLEVDDSQQNQRGMPKYILNVSYTYTFEGKPYTGDRLKRLTTESSDPRKLKGKVEAYAAGTNTICYVNPADPADAVLKKDTRAGLYTIWFPCLFIVGGAGMILSSLFRK